MLYRILLFSVKLQHESAIGQCWVLWLFLRTESAAVIVLGWSLSTSDGQPLHSVKALVSFAKLLKLPLLCMFISNSWAKCVVDIAVCLLLDDSFRTQMRKLLYLPRNMEYLYIYAYVICLFLSSVSYNFPYKVHLSPQVGLFLDIL